MVFGFSFDTPQYIAILGNFHRAASMRLRTLNDLR